MQLPHACREGRVSRTGEENVELGKVVGVVGAGREEVVGREGLVVERAMVGGEAAEGAGILPCVSSILPSSGMPGAYTMIRARQWAFVEGRVQAFRAKVAVVDGVRRCLE